MTIRTAIYARYSDDKQNELSVVDQWALIKSVMGPEERLVDTYGDEAITGEIEGRPGLKRLRQDVRDRKIDIVRIEALDRLGRDQEHLFGFHKVAAFVGTRIVSLREGDIDPMKLAMNGYVAAEFIRNVREKTWRGLNARAQRGQSTGGTCYGYRNEVQTDGTSKEVVDQDEAAIVRRIFHEYADGRSPQKIARDLNREEIPRPRRAKAWQHTTILGHRSRGTGILNNTRYIGRAVWNRRNWCRDPETECRVPQVRDQEEWVTVDRPDLRIVDDKLWERVKARQSRNGAQRGDNPGKRMARGHRPKRLLAGLLFCPECDGRMNVNGKYYHCRNHKSGGLCTNRRGVRADRLEQMVLNLLKTELFRDEYAEAFEQRYVEEVNRRREEMLAEERQLRKELKKAKQDIENLLNVLKRGVISDSVQQELTDLEERKRVAEGKLANLETPPVVQSHGRMADVFLMNIHNMERMLQHPDTTSEAATIMQALVSALYARPVDGGWEVDISGPLVALVNFATTPDVKRPHDLGAPGRLLTVVAGALNQVRRPIGEVSQGALFDLAVSAVAFPQQDGGRGLPVGNAFDVHGLSNRAPPNMSTHNAPIYMGTPAAPKCPFCVSNQEVSEFCK